MKQTRSVAICGRVAASCACVHVSRFISIVHESVHERLVGFLAKRLVFELRARCTMHAHKHTKRVRLSAWRSHAWTLHRAVGTRRQLRRRRRHRGSLTSSHANSLHETIYTIQYTRGLQTRTLNEPTTHHHTRDAHATCTI